MPEEQKRWSTERAVQMVIGAALWAYLLAAYIDLDWLDVAVGKLVFIALQFAFAGYLITGMTSKCQGLVEMLCRMSC